MPLILSEVSSFIYVQRGTRVCASSSHANQLDDVIDRRHEGVGLS